MRSNLRAIHGPLLPRRCWAVVKADAYGHGLEAALSGFSEADGLALIEPEGAMSLRDRGWSKPILLLEGVFDASDLRATACAGIDCVIHADWQLDLLQQADHRDLLQKHGIRLWIKFNSGMNRLGFAVPRGLALIEQLRSEGFQIGAMAHFANADALEGDPQSEQRMKDVLHAVKIISKAIPCSFTNSAASLRLAQPRIAGFDSLRPALPDALGADWLRLGIALYGACAFEGLAADSFHLKAAMSLESRVLAIQELQPGERVGYAGRFLVHKPSRIAVVAGGYADGYPRHAPDGTPVWIAGAICPLAGRVSMDLLTVDVSEQPHVAVGAPAELWGKHLSVDRVAHAAGTIAHELLAGLTERVPKVCVHAHNTSGIENPAAAQG